MTVSQSSFIAPSSSLLLWLNLYVLLSKEKTYRTTKDFAICLVPWPFRGQEKLMGDEATSWRKAACQLLEVWVPKAVNTGTSVVSGKLGADTDNTTDRELPNENIVWRNRGFLDQRQTDRPLKYRWKAEGTYFQGRNKNLTQNSELMVSIVQPHPGDKPLCTSTKKYRLGSWRRKPQVGSTIHGMGSCTDYEGSVAVISLPQ